MSLWNSDQELFTLAPEELFTTVISEVKCGIL
jgi:hypothetical protein